MPDNAQAIRVHEFKALMHMPSMTVSEYDVQFTPLSLYAQYLVSTEDIRIQHFMDGLLEPLFKAVASQAFGIYAFCSGLYSKN